MALKRILEKESMDDVRLAAEYAAIDRRAAAAEVALFARETLGFRRGRAADLGCGPADIPAALCRLLPGARVTALDLSAEMLSLAERRLRAAGAAARVALLRADARRTGLPAASFDLVLSNNLAHHAPAPAALFAEVRRLCRPGGAFLVRDLRRPRSLAELRSLLALAAGDTPAQLALLRASLRAALTADEARACALQAGLKDFVVEEEGARHWRLYRPAAGPR